MCLGLDFVQEFEEIKLEQPELHYKHIKEGREIWGKFRLDASFNDIRLEDEYFLKIFVPDLYPRCLPSVWELQGKIPKDYHINGDHTLCLGVKSEIYKFLEEHSFSLLDFMNKFLVEYLYRYAYIQKFNKAPWPDRAHGGAGVIEYYQEWFNLNDVSSVKHFLHIAQKNKYRPNYLCCCGSRRKYRNCHGGKIKMLIDLIPKSLLNEELGYIDQMVKFF